MKAPKALLHRYPFLQCPTMISLTLSQTLQVIGFERVCGILLEQGYQIPGAKQKIALLYGKDADFTAVLAKAADLRSSYNVTVLQQAKKLGKQLGQLEASGFSGAAFMDKDEIKIFAQQ